MRLIRWFAVAGFVVGFVLVLAFPLTVLGAMLESGDPTSVRSFTPGDVRYFSGVVGIGLLLALFSVALWFLGAERTYI